MKKTLILALAACAIIAALAVPGFVSAGRGHRVTITLADEGGVSISSTSSGQVAFNVQADMKKESDLYKLWVANKCSKDGSMFTAEYQPVHDGKASGFAVESGMDCTAYVWMFPSSEDPIRGATVSYHVD